MSCSLCNLTEVLLWRSGRNCLAFFYLCLHSIEFSCRVKLSKRLNSVLLQPRVVFTTLLKSEKAEMVTYVLTVVMFFSC